MFFNVALNVLKLNVLVKWYKKYKLLASAEIKLI